VRESEDTAETLDRRIRGMRAVAEAMKGLLEGVEDKKMRIDTLIRTTGKALARRRKKWLCRPNKNRGASERGGAREGGGDKIPDQEGAARESGSAWKYLAWTRCRTDGCVGLRGRCR
jgi:hypothetical protein